MKCEVKPVYKNLRYRFLITENEYYLVDMGHSFLKILFPFLFWVIPTPAYKLKDLTILDTFRSRIEEQQFDEVVKKRKNYTGWGASLGFLLASSLIPLRKYNILPDTLLINIVTLCVITLSILVFVVYMLTRFQNTIYRFVNLNELKQEKIFMRSIPSVPSMPSFTVVGIYVGLLFFTIILFQQAIKYPDIQTYLFIVIVFSVYSFTHSAALAPGKATVKFKNNKHL